jgi:hypothetical protein
MPYCTKCGKEVSAGERFCRSCGTPLTAQQASPERAAPSARSAENAAGISDAEMAAFVGKNADVYLAKFGRFVGGGGSFAVTWHWPAFLFGFFWMVYRKLYLWAVVALIVGFIPYLGLISHVVFGMTANYLYYSAVRDRIRRVRSLPARGDVDRAAALSRAGGTNSAVVVLVPLIIVVLAIIAAIAIPSFVSYRQRAYDAQAKTEVQDACRRLADVFDREPGRYEVTPEDLLNSGFSPSTDVEMMLLDGRRGSLGLSAQHKEGKRVFITDPACTVREERKGPSEEI